jgi:hypothetical protein
MCRSEVWIVHILMTNEPRCILLVDTARSMKTLDIVATSDVRTWQYFGEAIRVIPIFWSLLATWSTMLEYTKGRDRGWWGSRLKNRQIAEFLLLLALAI